MEHLLMTLPDNIRKDNEETRQAWNRNAGFWDERMGEGNDFVNLLEWPSIERLLALQPGERVLDAACGNGLTSRRMAALGAQVVAFDFAADMIAAARQYPAMPGAPPIEYQVLDATDELSLRALGPGSFDAALCNMALMDMAEIRPLMRALAGLLRLGGRFVFTLLHPCFNGATSRVGEMTEVDGEPVLTYAIKVARYLTPSTEHGSAILGQPQKQLYFFRPLHLLLNSAFEAGLVMDGIEETSFPPDTLPGRRLLNWSGLFSEFPPILAVRMRWPQE
jgi:2-polyprenyl-3-methyl-5-hydroxy-6-metoxy-1,4-benzoquinol methylase